jgi:glyoxylase-like metal-dependent hydrolase (beta-lactamase superfamily II)
LPTGQPRRRFDRSRWTGVPQLPEIVSLVRRIPPSRRQDGHDCVTVFAHLSVACHGLSVLVRGQVGERRGAVLFDVGPYGRVWLDDAKRLGIDLAIVERVFLSHWHWDHSGALLVVLKAVADARRAAGLPAPVVDASTRSAVRYHHHAAPTPAQDEQAFTILTHHKSVNYCVVCRSSASASSKV